MLQSVYFMQQSKMIRLKLIQAAEQSLSWLKQTKPISVVRPLFKSFNFYLLVVHELL